MDNNTLKNCKTERDVDDLTIQLEKELGDDDREIVSRHWSDAQRTLFKACLLYMIEKQEELTWENLVKLIDTYPIVRGNDDEMNKLFNKHKKKCISKKIESKACLCYEVFKEHPYKVQYTAAVCLISSLEEYFGL